MPIYEYQAKDTAAGCEHCRKGFECIQRISDPPVDKCPKCGGAVVKVISAPSIGSSASGFDQRAKNAGFTKFKKLGKGEYERKY